MTKLDIRSATLDEFAIAIDWAAAEGWNPGWDDLAAFYAADPNGFLLGWVGDEPVSSISVVRYGKQFGFLGFYIVHPNWRGQGHGIATWNAGMRHLDGRTIGLDGVMEQQDNYARSGFAFDGLNIRFSGVPQLPEPIPTAEFQVLPVHAEDVADILAYEIPFFPDDRSQFMRSWVEASGIQNRKTYCVRAADGSMIGFGVIRSCRRGHKIGPLLCENSKVAEALIRMMANTVSPTDEVTLDVPEKNEAAMDLARSLALKPVFKTARMWTGPVADLQLDRTFGVCTFELG